MAKIEIAAKAKLPKPHPKQILIIKKLLSGTKRIIIRAGRRGGKTYVAAIIALLYFLFRGKRVLYAAPTSEQTDRFWHIITTVLAIPIKFGVWKKNESDRFIEKEGTNQRIKAKTAWNADTLRGDFADLLILDEFQLMHESTWVEVGAPMLLDNNGDAIFIYTPPSLRTLARSRADNPRFASEMFKRFNRLMEEGNPRYAAFHFSSQENPYISAQALSEIAGDMTEITYRMEILAEDIDEAPTALWKRATIERNRLLSAPPNMERLVVAVDPSGSSKGNECGIITCGKTGNIGYVLKDISLQSSPKEWGQAAINEFHQSHADRIVAESNYGGEMVKTVINSLDPTVPVKLVWATRGKIVRAEPIASLSESNQIKFCGSFPKLEDELCIAGDSLIMTKKGEVEIHSISAGDMVLTRKGFRKVLWSGQTGITNVIRITTKQNKILLITDNHPVYTKEYGFIKARNLKSGFTLEAIKWHTCRLNNINTENLSSSKAKDGLSITVDTTWTGKESFYIGKFIKKFTETSLPEFLFTIKMVIKKITNCLTLRLYRQKPTFQNIHGTGGLRPKELGSLLNLKNDGGTNSLAQLSVTAGENLKASESGQRIVQSVADIVLKVEQTNLFIPVYNLTIGEEPEYFANGILVHNCLWTDDNVNSPNHLDAFVWGMHDLMIKSAGLIFRNIWNDKYLFNDASMPEGLLLGHQQRYIALNQKMNDSQSFLDIMDDGVIFWVCREYYHDYLIEGSIGNSQLITKLQEFTHEIKNPQYIINPDSEQFEQELLLNGIVCTSPEEDFKGGLGLLLSFMSKGRIRIHERCTNLLRDINQYVWDTNEKKDLPAPGNDRAITALRFAVMSKVNIWRTS